MAALRIFARSKLSAIISTSLRSEIFNCTAPAVLQVSKRWGNFKSSPIYKDPSQYTDYDISEDPKEWEYVERLLKPKLIPKTPHGNVELPSGWKPASAKPTDYPYFINRTKNGMQPIYVERTDRGMRKVTFVRKIDGDIWLLEADLKRYLKQKTNVPIGTRINEIQRLIKFRGDFVSHITEWANMKGF